MGSGSWAGDPSWGEDQGPGRGWLWGSVPGEDCAHLCALLEQEKSQLEERLLQTATTIQQLEAELQAFQKSCLLQLARSSWVGRILRSSTGSVEVNSPQPTALPPASPPQSSEVPWTARVSPPGALALACLGSLSPHPSPAPPPGPWGGTRQVWPGAVRSEGRGSFPRCLPTGFHSPLAGGNRRNPAGTQRPP